MIRLKKDIGCCIINWRLLFEIELILSNYELFRRLK